MKKWRIAGINFDHFHMGDLLGMVLRHPGAELVGVSDEVPGRMEEALRRLGLPADLAYADYRDCLERARPELVILCPAAARHAEWTERVAPYGVHLLVEKPFAASLAEADRMLAATEAGGGRLAINWPLAWMASHRRCEEIVRAGAIGELREVHYYGGNRGPLWHGAGKSGRERPPGDEEKAASWFYQAAEGGGSLQDYLGYGTTLGTWFHGGKRPLEVAAMWDRRPGGPLEVDEQSVTVARYETGLSTFQTRWGTFTDPWTHQPQPRCGFVVVGSEGTVASADYADHVTVQGAAHPGGRREPAPAPVFPFGDPVSYFLHCLESGAPVEGPLSPGISRIGQQIVDTACASAGQGRALALLG